MSTASRGRRLAGIMGLTLAAATAACGYDGAATGYGSGPGTGDTTATAALVAAPRVITASGDLTAALAEFRARLGGSANRTVGEQPSGRREVNWDGVTGALLNVDTFPADFFNRVVPRGQIYRTEGRGFRVSDNDLADLNPAYATEFSAFSPTKIFVAAGSRAMSVRFVVAGGTAPALVNGFGVVFSDVDVAEVTGLAFFDSAGRLLRRVSAPVRTDAAGFSFVGVTFAAPVVARVVILSGQATITGLTADISAGGETDQNGRAHV